MAFWRHEWLLCIGLFFGCGGAPNAETWSLAGWGDTSHRVNGYVFIPDEAPPPNAEERLEARLEFFARSLEKRRPQRRARVRFESVSLREKIETIIREFEEHAHLSIHVRELDTGEVLFDYYGDSLLNPASNHKILTSAAAIDLLGPDYVFRTRVLLQGNELRLVGEGDPSLDEDALHQLAQAVADKVDVASLERLVVDDGGFSPRRLAPGFEEEGPGVSYQAPSGALSFNFNTVEVTVYPVKGSRSLGVRVWPPSTHIELENRSRIGRGRPRVRSSAKNKIKNESRKKMRGVSRSKQRTRIEVSGSMRRGERAYRVRRRVVDPALFTGGAFALMLSEISHTAPLEVSTETSPAKDAGLEELAVHVSPPLLEIVDGGMAYSNNFVAEQLLRTLGWRLSGTPGDWENGGAVIRGYWEAMGGSSEDLVFENGSGMSALGRVSSSALVDLIAVAHRNQARGKGLLDTFPVAGIEGTMRARLRRTGKRVRAKTGTLDGVSGLSGVLTDEDGTPRIAFSILTNLREGGEMTRTPKRAIEDAVVIALLGHLDDWESRRIVQELRMEALEVHASKRPPQ